MNNLFEVAKTVPVPELAEKYGGVKPIQRGGTIWSCCPIHSERTPSCKYDSKGFYCFGCHEHGSGIDLVMKLLNLDSKSACMRICEDFKLNVLEDPTKNDHLQVRQMKAEKRNRKTIEEGFRLAHIVLTDYLQLVDDIISREYTREEYASQDMPDEVVKALKSRDEVAQILDEYDRVSFHLEDQERFLEEHKTDLARYGLVVNENRKAVSNE